MFNSFLQYSLINWGRASKCYLQKIKTIQNCFLRASLFHKRDCSLKVLYSMFGVLKLDDMIETEYAKFIFRFNKKICNLNTSIITLLNLKQFTTTIQVKKQKMIFSTILLVQNGGERWCSVKA